MFYSIGEVSKLLNIPASTLRFYDKEGLLPGMARTTTGIRRFSDDDLAWLRVIDCLKRSGMTIKEITNFISLVQQGDSTLEERQAIFEQQRVLLEKKILELEKMKQVMDYKCWFYDVAVKAGTVEAPLKMKEKEIPKELVKIRKYIHQGKGKHKELI